MTRWLIAALLAGAALGAPAFAQQGPEGGPGRVWGGGMAMLRGADINSDGVITRDEFIQATDARFNRMDANHDGVLQDSERPMRRPRPSRMGDAPPSPDGAPMAPGGPPPRAHADLTREQYREAALRRFDRMDTNHDGKLDQNEVQAAADLMRFRGPPGAQPGQTPPPPADGQ